jgi:molecular chaperone Hsp33
MGSCLMSLASEDYLYRFLFEEFGVRGEFVRLDASWEAVQERHDYPGWVKPALGQTLTAVTLLSGTSHRAAHDSWYGAIC